MIRQPNTDYMYDNKWTADYIERCSHDYEDRSAPHMTVIDNATILPAKICSGKAWGLGGALDEAGMFVNESAVTTVFGGKYDYKSDEVLSFDEEVYYIPVIPNQWGHFLIDVLCRFWFVLRDDYRRLRIATTLVAFKDGKLSDNYLAAFGALGINEEDIIIIDKPSSFRKVYIPSETMSFKDLYNSEFKNIMDHIAENVYDPSQRHYSKCYFTRIRFPGARKNEIGEYEIAKAFNANGYKVVSPEKCTLAEQVTFFRNADIIVSVGGTIPHNAVFAKPGTKLIILNRTCILNDPQIRIGKLMDIDTIYVDVYSKWNEENPVDYGNGPFWLYFSEQLELFFKDNGMIIPEYDFEKINRRNKRIFSKLIIRNRLYSAGVKVYTRVKSLK